MAEQTPDSIITVSYTHLDVYKRQCKDRLLEILHKYLHLQQEKDEKTGEVKSERMIFPRYHQLDVVTKLLADVKANGSGKNYLIQHSAGSGKSNSIAWLAHRLTGLHDKHDEKIFQSVIIVTDRRVLDSQLQNTEMCIRDSMSAPGRICGVTRSTREQCSTSRWKMIFSASRAGCL